MFGPYGESIRPKSEVDAKAKLSDLVAATVFPVLPAATVTRLIRDARRVDQYSWLPSWDDEWAPGVVYVINDVVVPTTRNGHVYLVTAGGTSGTIEPVWPIASQATITANGVTYQEITEFVSVWLGEWDISRAAAEGWRIKAGMVSNRHTFGSNQGNYNPEQIFDHCNKMADYFAAKQVSSVVVASGRWDGQGRLPGAHFEDAQ